MNAVTLIHAIVDRCRAADYPGLVFKMHSGWVVMGERQVLPGYCLLLPDPVMPHLNALPGARRGEFLADMAAVGDALLGVSAALRINYAIFGNVDPALHAHIFPRGGSEPEASRAAQPWALDWNAAPLYTETIHGDFKRRLAAELAKRT